MNQVILIGRLTKEPEIRYTQSNTAVGTFTLAVNRPKQKDKEQEADFINIVVWDKQAELVQKYLNKGSLISIIGRIQTRSYEAENGQKRYVTEVVASKIQFLDNKKDGQTTETTKQASQTNPYEEMGKQVSMEEYPNIDDDSLPF